MKNKILSLALLLALALTNGAHAAKGSGPNNGIFTIAALGVVGLGGWVMYEANRINPSGPSSAINIFGAYVRGREAQTGEQLNIFTRTFAAVYCCHRYSRGGGWND